MLAPALGAAVEIVVAVVLGKVVGLAVEIVQPSVVDAVRCAADGVAEVGVWVRGEEIGMGKGENDVGRGFGRGFGGDEETVDGGSGGDGFDARLHGRLAYVTRGRRKLGTL